MIFEALTVLLGALIVYHIYKSVTTHQNVIGDLYTNMHHIVTGRWPNPLFRSGPTFTMHLPDGHPSEAGIQVRRVGHPEGRLNQMFIDPGPKKTEGQPTVEATRPGLPTGLAVPTNPGLDGSTGGDVVGVPDWLPANEALGSTNGLFN